jgi:hypothetical protein
VYAESERTQGAASRQRLEVAQKPWQDLSMPTKIPGWVVSNLDSVRREAARYRDMTPEQKIDLVASACRTAATLLDASPNRDHALTLVDPLPPTSAAALERLRRQYRETCARRQTR